MYPDVVVKWFVAETNCGHNAFGEIRVLIIIYGAYPNLIKLAHF